MKKKKHFETKCWRGLNANLHNFKTCIAFDSVGIFRWGFQHSGFLITVIKIMESSKNVFKDPQTFKVPHTAKHN